TKNQYQKESTKLKAAGSSGFEHDARLAPSRTYRHRPTGSSLGFGLGLLSRRIPFLYRTWVGLVGTHLGQDFVEQCRLAWIDLRRRRLFMPVVVIAMAGPATDLGRLLVDHRNDGVIHNAFAFHAKVIDDIA